MLPKSGQAEEVAMGMLRVYVPKNHEMFVPTHHGDTEEALAAHLAEFDDPNVPVLVEQSSWLRIVLGSHDLSNQGAPGLRIERRKKGWMIVLLPKGGGDPSGCVFFMDDGRSFLVPEQWRWWWGDTPACGLGEWDEVVAVVDGLKSDLSEEE
jgi:hypothetical protein